jgi:hypothetical protein
MFSLRQLGQVGMGKMGRCESGLEPYLLEEVLGGGRV